jgi:hypothetical protein
MRFIPILPQEMRLPELHIFSAEGVGTMGRCALSGRVKALRGIAIGRQNYLFAGADSGGERVAAINSLIGAAKLKGSTPSAWLRHVLAHIADHPANRVNDFLPWHCSGQLAAT